MPESANDPASVPEAQSPLRQSQDCLPLAISEDGRRLAALCSGSRLRLWNAAGVFEAETQLSNPLRRLVLNRDGSWILLLDALGGWAIWSPEQNVGPARPQQSAGVMAQFSMDGTELLVQRNNGPVDVFPLDAKRMLAQLWQRVPWCASPEERLLIERDEGYSVNFDKPSVYESQLKPSVLRGLELKPPPSPLPPSPPAGAPKSGSSEQPDPAQASTPNTGAAEALEARACREYLACMTAARLPPESCTETPQTADLPTRLTSPVEPDVRRHDGADR